MEIEEIGNKLKNYRIKNKIKQDELAKTLGISNKAVSKWETGKSLPSIKTLTRLAKIFDVSLDEIFKDEKDTGNKKITKIVLTGGPCSGKSTAMCLLQKEFSKKGYYVLFVNETATELILGGINPWSVESNYYFQKAMLLLQIKKEDIYFEAAKHVDNYDKILIVCDRGSLDGKAYLGEEEHRKMLAEMSLSEVALMDRYDAVFHLVSAAKGARDFYNCENNAARYETADEASARDDKLLSTWTGHPHFRVIDNSTSFEEKMKRLVLEISSFLGEPLPFEIERKFLIEYPDLKKLEKLENCKKVEIIQTYLKSENGTELRIRQRGTNGNYSYTKTIKQQVSDIKRIEEETRLSKDEYLTLLMNADTTKKQIRKTRYCLMLNNHYFEIDVYPFWKDKAILEIELRDENQKIHFPKFLKIIKEVTGDKNYYNHSLADNMN